MEKKPFRSRTPLLLVCPHCLKESGVWVCQGENDEIFLEEIRGCDEQCSDFAVKAITYTVETIRKIYSGDPETMKRLSEDLESTPKEKLIERLDSIRKRTEWRQ